MTALGGSNSAASRSLAVPDCDTGPAEASAQARDPDCSLDRL